MICDQHFSRKPVSSERKKEKGIIAMMKEQTGISERVQEEAAPDTMKDGTTEAESRITRGEADESVSGQGGTSETVQAEEQVKQSRGSLFEGIYDQLPDISVRSVDRFIILCVIALVAVILIGVLKANHIF